MEELQKEFNKRFNHIPDSIRPLTFMESPNEAIRVYDGSFTLKHDTNVYEATGSIKFFWFPQPEARIYGTMPISTLLAQDFKDQVTHQLYLNNQHIGPVVILEISEKPELNKLEIKGQVTRKLFTGDLAVPVDTVHFELPNMNDFAGDPIKTDTTIARGRITLQDNKYIIHLDQNKNYREKKNKLKEQGGYVLLYSGQIKSKVNSLDFNEAAKILVCLHYFLSFITGRRISALFVKGVSNGKPIWSTFNPGKLNSYKPIKSWSSKHNLEGLSYLWERFFKTSKSSKDFECLKSVIHWYTEANHGAGYVQGSIMMVQSALELLYNWIIIENKKIIKGGDAKNITADNKIRLLLSYHEIDYSIPIDLSELIHYSKGKMDGPESLVKIRNAIVHSEESKRTELNDLTPKVLVDCLELGLSYIERTVLRYMQFKGKYVDRCAAGAYIIESDF